MTFHDIRLALRSLVHDRSVSAIVILCLALGIGVNATLFSVIEAGRMHEDRPGAGPAFTASSRLLSRLTPP